MSDLQKNVESIVVGYTSRLIRDYEEQICVLEVKVAFSHFYIACGVLGGLVIGYGVAQWLG